MDSVTWAAIKDIASFLWIPLGAFMTYYVNREKESKRKVEETEQRITFVEGQVKILEIQVSGIKDDLQEVRRGVEKLVDKLLK